MSNKPITTKLCLILCILVAASLGIRSQDKDIPFSISVIGPAGVTLGGEPLTFTANISGEIPYEFSYLWSVSEGEIISGQGTPAISVRTPKEGGSVTATLTLVPRDATFAGKRVTASEVAVVAQIPKAELFDALPANWNCELGLARMDNFYIALNNNPNAQGYITIFAGKSDKKGVLSHQLLLTNSVKFRKFDPSRITFLTTVSEDPRTEFWLVPPGAEPPQAGSSDFDPIRKETRPYIYGLESSDGVTGCDETPYDPASYAGQLKGSKDRGKVVIRETSIAKFRRKEREVRSALQKAGVVQSRIVTQFIKVRPNRTQESVELWIIPK